MVIDYDKLKISAVPPMCLVVIPALGTLQSTPSKCLERMALHFVVLQTGIGLCSFIHSYFSHMCDVGTKVTRPRTQHKRRIIICFGRSRRVILQPTGFHPVKPLTICDARNGCAVLPKSCARFVTIHYHMRSTNSQSATANRHSR